MYIWFTLSIVDLGHLNPEAVPPQQPHYGKNGHARKRRHERRAAARCQAEAVEASKSAEKAETSSANALDNNEKVVENGQNLINKEDNSKTGATVIEEVTDEFCPNKDYEKGSKDDQSQK